MDVDLRRPSLAEVFRDDEHDVGLVDVLRGDLPWQRTVIRTDIANLDFLPTGETHDIPIEILGTLELRQLLIALSEPLRPRDPRRAGDPRPGRLPDAGPGRRRGGAGRPLGGPRARPLAAGQGDARAVARGPRRGGLQRPAGRLENWSSYGPDVRPRHAGPRSGRGRRPSPWPSDPEPFEIPGVQIAARSGETARWLLNRSAISALCELSSEEREPRISRDHRTPGPRDDLAISPRQRLLLLADRLMRRARRAPARGRPRLRRARLVGPAAPRPWWRSWSWASLLRIALAGRWPVLKSPLGAWGARPGPGDRPARAPAGADRRGALAGGPRLACRGRPPRLASVDDPDLRVPPIPASSDRRRPWIAPRRCDGSSGRRAAWPSSR